jgi:succinate dehydrogenase / fumarate reductase cytochrome b subunit
MTLQRGSLSLSNPTTKPLSPHLSVWRWHVTMLTSILHRASRVALYGAALIFAGWTVALGSGPAPYRAFMAIFAGLPGKMVMFSLTVAVFYHLASGLRHLVWDAGRGLDIKTANATSGAVIAFAFGASVAVWGLALTKGAF